MVALNALFDIIAAGFENTLSLDGTTPNSMQADIDLNSNDLLNVYSIFAQFFKDSAGNLISLADINTLGAIVADLELLADIQDGTIATGAITTVAGIAADVVTVASIAGDVVTVSSISADVTAVAADAVDIGLVAGSIANVNTVGGSIADVNAVAGDLANINAVGAIADDVAIVADNVVDVTNFADVYLGASAVDPTTRTSGAALETGDLYFNTATDELFVWSGSAWVISAPVVGTPSTDLIDVTATANAGAFPLVFHQAAAGAGIALSSSTGMTVNASTSTLSVNGDVIAYAASDRRLKANITPISGAVDKVKQLSGNTYDWIEDPEIHDFAGADVGVIAQEVEAVFPELVSTRPNGYKAVRYDKLVAVLIEAVKELSAEVDALKGDK